MAEAKRRSGGVQQSLQNFLRLESAGGILLAIATLVALAFSNSPLEPVYQWLLDLPVTVTIGRLGLSKPLLLWINDGLMAVFFLLVGLEMKREIFEGELSSREQVLLPATAAIGGIVVPAAIYAYVNWDAGDALNGWAIPTATDIAFALGVLSLLGSRVPLSLKVFLLAIAIIDDLAAILVIGIFYSKDISIESLALSLALLVVMVSLNRRGVSRIAAYIVPGTFMWLFMVKSGVHATLAGVLTALCIPLRSTDEGMPSPLRHLEHTLHPWVAFGVLPLFAFANAGLSFEGLSLSDLTGSVPVGIVAGLVVGKQVGVFGTIWLMISLGLARRPEGTTWLQLYGVSILCGIGFTMSLFIGSLAFEHGEFDYEGPVRLGVLLASFIAVVLGYLILRWGSHDDQSGQVGTKKT